MVDKRNPVLSWGSGIGRCPKWDKQPRKLFLSNSPSLRCLLSGVCLTHRLWIGLWASGRDCTINSKKKNLRIFQIRLSYSDGSPFVCASFYTKLVRPFFRGKIGDSSFLLVESGIIGFFYFFSYAILFVALLQRRACVWWGALPSMYNKGGWFK